MIGQIHWISKDSISKVFSISLFPKFSKSNLDISTSNKHKNRHSSTKDLFHPQNLNEDRDSIKDNKKKLNIEKENKEKVNYNEILDEMKERNC